MGELFGPIFVPAALRDATGDRAWLQAMLDAEAALAGAQARAGVIPAEAAEAIAAAASDAGRFDIEAIGEAARAPGNPAAPLSTALAEAAGDDAGRYVHWGATSQDILDTAAMLVARRALDLIVAELDAVAGECAGLAETHRATLMAARTLLQQALPTTFGLKAAGWLAGALDARERLVAIRDGRLAVQLGGAAGTLASLGDAGPVVVEGFADALGLAAPEVPWHTSRTRVAELGAALAVAAGALAKIALDLELLAQTEVGEVAEANAGGSSAMPHKRNPVGAALTRACAMRVQGAAAVLMAAMAQEHERAAGAWHAEWEPLGQALALTGGAAAALRGALDGLEVDAGRMRANLDMTGGMLMTEHLMMVLAAQVGRPEAKRMVGDAAGRSARSGRPLREELGAEVTDHLDAETVEAALDPAGYLGSSGEFIDRVLARYRAVSA